MSEKVILILIIKLYFEWPKGNIWLIIFRNYGAEIAKDIRNIMNFINNN